MKSADINFKNLWKPVLIGLAMLFLYASVLTKLVGHWWVDDNYSHGLLVPFVIAFIIWFKLDELKKTPKLPSFRIGGGLVVFALVMLLGGTLGAELFVQRISLLLMLAGLVIYFFGSYIFRLLIVPFILLLLAIPIPQIIFNKIAFPLQIYASQIAVWGIRIFGVPTVRKGNVIEILPEGAVQVIALEVVEACSGIRSLMTLMTLALILVYFTRRNQTNLSKNRLAFLTDADFWRGLGLMLSAVPIAILTNAGRVTATGVLTYYYGKKATEGLAHDLAGWLVYLVALGLLIGINFLLRRLFSWKRSERSAFSTQQSVLSTSHSLWFLCAILLAGGLFINWFENRGEAGVERKPLGKVSSVLGDWKQKGGDIRFTEATESVLKTSDYVMREYVREDGRLANIYIGYYASQKTGATYHSPQNCLPGAGWEMKNPALVEIRTPSGKTFQANRYIIENGRYKEIMLYWYQGRGRTQASEYYDKVYTVWDSITRRRSDGALVRVMTSVGYSEPEATKAAVDLAAQTADRLAEFVPE